ncbi:MAG: YdeI/OmpD-associated family protein [Eudoraea sp.]|nr:YdeI/OmpD-associated family protein [Eudoraea sp.]MBT8291724.1 YdeI/OmpD-associated family protein [Eudoraea sp.]
MKSGPFEVALRNTHALLLPYSNIRQFIINNLKRVRVIATFEGKTIEFYGALQKRNNDYYLIFGKTNQKALGVYPNDYFEIQLFEDSSEYGVDMPEELHAVLISDLEAYNIFKDFTGGKKRSIIYTIKRYRRSETRIEKSILLTNNLKKGITDLRVLFK